MPVFATLTPTFQLWKITETLPELLLLLPKDVELPDYKSEHRLKEWAAVHVLVQRILGYFVPVRHKESGMPYLEGEEKCITLSHSRNFVAVYISDKKVGVDVECISDRANRVRSRFMDWQEGFSHDAEERTALEATLIWSVKEAVFKVLPIQEEVDFLKHIRTEQVSFSLEGEIQAHELRSSLQQSYNVYYKVFPEFVLTVSVPV